MISVETKKKTEFILHTMTMTKERGVKSETDQQPYSSIVEKLKLLLYYQSKKPCPTQSFSREVHRKRLVV